MPSSRVLLVHGDCGRGLHGLNNEALPKRKMWFCPLGGVAAGGRGHRQEQGIGSKGRERRGTDCLGGLLHDVDQMKCDGPIVDKGSGTREKEVDGGGGG